MAVKVAYQPLLGPGRHTMTMNQLKSLAVGAFPTSTRRPVLFSELARLHSELVAVSAICELWVDGSFLTEKLEPDDIDLCFATFDSDFNRLAAGVRDAILTNLNGGKEFSPHLDTYLCFRFLRDDPRARADTSDYWGHLWGVGHDDSLKGFVVVKLGETDVGTKLLA